MLKLEKVIRGKLVAIENAKTKQKGIELIKDAKLNNKLSALKSVDEVASDELQKRYMKAVKENSKKS